MNNHPIHLEEEQRSAGSSQYWHGLHQLTHLINGEWVPAILASLAHGPRHFTEILTAIQTTGVGQPDPNRWLHDSILGRTLRRMEDNGLVTRHEVVATFPKSTTYELTPWTVDLLSALMPAVHWTTSRAHQAPHRSLVRRISQSSPSPFEATLCSIMPKHSAAQLRVRP